MKKQKQRFSHLRIKLLKSVDKRTMTFTWKTTLTQGYTLPFTIISKKVLGLLWTVLMANQVLMEHGNYLVIKDNT